MHIVMLTHRLFGGGIQVVVRNLSNLLLTQNIRVTVLCSHETEPMNERFETESLAFQGKKGYPLLQRYLDNLDTRPDMIIAHSYDAYRALARLKSYQDCAYYYLHVDYYAMYYQQKKWLKNLERTIKYRRIFANKNLLSVSQGALTAMTESIGAKPKTARVIPPPVDRERLLQQASETPDDLPSEPYFVSLARFTSRKRIDIAIRALKLSGTHKRLLIIGEGNEEASLKELVHKEGLDQQVTFLGWKENPFPYLRQADALLSTSTIEGLGLTLIEAMMLGTPAISTDAKSGPAEILGETFRDLLSAVEDANAFAQRIKHFEQVSTESRFDTAALAAHVDSYLPNQVIRKFEEIWQH